MFNFWPFNIRRKKREAEAKDKAERNARQQKEWEQHIATMESLKKSQVQSFFLSTSNNLHGNSFAGRQSAYDRQINHEQTSMDLMNPTNLLSPFNPISPLSIWSSFSSSSSSSSSSDDDCSRHSSSSSSWASSGDIGSSNYSSGSDSSSSCSYDSSSSSSSSSYD